MSSPSAYSTCLNFYAVSFVAIDRILETVRQFRSVIESPSNRSAFAASFDLPTPLGACR